MKLAALEQLPYTSNSAQLFDRLVDLDWPVFLDSGSHLQHSSHARFDILAANPYQKLITRGDCTSLLSAKDSSIHQTEPLALLRSLLAQEQADIEVQTSAHLPPEAEKQHIEELPADLPFIGGAIGFFSYDLGRQFEKLPQLAENCDQLPDMMIGLYDWAVIVDHQNEKTWLLRQGRAPLAAADWEAIRQRLLVPASEQPSTETALHTTAPFQASISMARYSEALAHIQAFIRAGDCYQVNYTQRFSAPIDGNAWLAYKLLRQHQGTPFGAFLRFADVEVLSFSPERFLHLAGDIVTTEPIKGTRPRASDATEDQALREALATSLKDRAENLMIVDLLRNDLGRVCVPGSIKVPELFRLDSFPSVHHLISRVTGQLRPDQDALSLLQACFPGGSITGAPKIRAMEIIEALEPCRRGLYCGAIGYISFDGRMDSNIAIRTLVCQQGEAGRYAHYAVGGGITADSDSTIEYQESLDKARVFRDFFAH